MERLTRRVPTPDDCVVVYTKGMYRDTIPAEMSNTDIRTVLRALADYEDLEEQGRLRILPCKVGDEVFVIGAKYRAGQNETWINTGKFTLSDLERLGKTVFLTKEEAKEALAGWQQSLGANREYGYAQGKGLVIWEEEENDEKIP